MKRVLVTGATGTLGQQLVKQLVYHGYDVGVLTTRPNVALPATARLFIGDLTCINTLQDAAQYPDIIIHCASNPQKPKVVDLAGTSNLLQVIDKNKVRHFIYVSIAGVDKSDYPYYQVKYEVENIIKASGLSWSIIRATQFHDLVLNRLIKPFDGSAGSALRVASNMRFQSIDVKDVSEKISAIASGSALRSTITVGGPEVLTIVDMVKQYLSVQGRSDRIQPDDVQTEFYNLFRSGINLSPEGAIGKITWRSFLQSSVYTTNNT